MRISDWSSDVCSSDLKRRRRKRGTYPDPARRIFINDAVCEGCGDCSVKSNCLSVETLETPLGTKCKINQSSCNKDFSCVTGFRSDKRREGNKCIGTRRARWPLCQ